MEGIAGMIELMFFAICVLLPLGVLGLWKAVEIILWLCHHLRFVVR